MPTPYSYSEFLAAVYADTTKTRIVMLYEDNAYAVKILGLYGVTMCNDRVPKVDYVRTEFNDASGVPSNIECSRVGNTFIAKETGVAKVVVPQTYDPTLVDRVASMMKALKDGDANTTYKYIQLISSHTKNKLAEHNQHREYKSSRQGMMKACPL